MSFIGLPIMSSLNNLNLKKDFKIFQEKVDALNLKIGNEAKKFNSTQIKDQDLIRKLKWLTNLGTSALSPEKLKRY